MMAFLSPLIWGKKITFQFLINVFFLLFCNQVTYHVTKGNEEAKFKISESDGYISIQQPLDYETTKLYRLTVTARDQGPIPKENSQIFTISVTDVNDYPPTFQQNMYDAFIAENQPIRSFVFQAQAQDLDADLSPVEYEITGDQQGIAMFGISRQTGEVTTTAVLDYEAVSRYNLQVRAVNPGTALSGSTTIRVHVMSVNEFAPRFRQAVYTWDVQESATTGTVVGTVNATDQDKGKDGIVEYYLVEDSNLQGFAIDMSTGKVIVVQEIDREATSEIVLKIMAKNAGPIRGLLLDFCEVRIRVGDANDPPRFTQSLYEKSILENSTVSSSVIQVTANDKDIDNANSQFYYNIESGNVGGAFTIGQSSGVIRVAGALDREVLAVYSMAVTATDSGTPPKTGQFNSVLNNGF